MICYAPDPCLAGMFAPEYGVPEEGPLPSLGEAVLGLACLALTCVILGSS
ncbi:hypothetical protein [Roseovarius sp. MBR-6]|jgi:hypothetical protein